MRLFNLKKRNKLEMYLNYKTKWSHQSQLKPGITHWMLYYSLYCTIMHRVFYLFSTGVRLQLVIHLNVY